MPLERMRAKPHSVYLSGKEGPFRCDHCEHYPTPNGCNHPSIIAFAKAGRYGLSMLNSDLARVDPAGCSDYFEKK